ncbi:MAG: hypothetical protein Ct9H90mV3_420 [uncultured marine virus]|jgi:hypothetical protein|nr:MAG: hypothetical protein Ct9H90mV3_420 [uncultured marine virus]GIS39848.1 MAG: hypothetical protein Ct9H90mP12_0420 [bacterium]|tara:strand:+ start:661 stop:882 length:222 start_codon:yes stop_codon:yes gene_type:complete
MKYFKYIIISGLYTSAEILMACATCFGDPNSNAGKGMDMAIITLLGIIGPLLFAIAIGIISIGIKSKRLNETK